MSTWIKCDKCNKLTEADSSGEKRHKIGIDDFNGFTTLHVCDWCLRSFYLEFLGWKPTGNGNSEYVPNNESEGE
jgi:hypothetical protein